MRAQSNFALYFPLLGFDFDEVSTGLSPQENGFELLRPGIGAPSLADRVCIKADDGTLRLIPSGRLFNRSDMALA